MQPSLQTVLATMNEVDRMRSTATDSLPARQLATRELVARVAAIYAHQGIVVDTATIEEAAQRQTLVGPDTSVQDMAALRSLKPAAAAAVLLADPRLTNKAGRVSPHALVHVFQMAGKEWIGNQAKLCRHRMQTLCLSEQTPGAPLAAWQPSGRMFNEYFQDLSINDTFSLRYAAWENRYLSILMLWRLLKHGRNKQLVVYRAQWMPDWNTHMAIDDQAERFAMELLLPQSLILDAMRWKPWRMRPRSPAGLARRLGVPEAMLRARLEQLGAITNPTT